MHKFGLRAVICAFAIVLCVGYTFAQTPSADAIRGSQAGTSANPTSLPDKLVEMQIADIELGHIGVMKAQDPRVKDYAEMVIRDHTQALTRMAKDQAITIKTSTPIDSDP